MAVVDIEVIANKDVGVDVSSRSVDVNVDRTISSITETISDLPNVTDDDNGKILQVVGGEWQATEYDALDESELQNAVNDALEQAKESGEFDGKDGKDGASGKDGSDGVSPVVAVTSITGGHRITITDKNGTKTVDVMDGVDGSAGKDGAAGKDGRGIKSVARTSGTGAAGTTDTYTITYTDNTTSTFTVYNGKNGTNGKDGTSVTVKSVSESTADGGSNVVTFSDGKTLTVKNGKTGAAGKDGKDYVLTDADKDEIAEMVGGGVFRAIPKTIHIAVGKEFRMYYKNVLSRYADRLWLGYTSGITVKRYPEYLSITANEATTQNISWKIYDEVFKVLDSGAMMVVATADAPKTSKVLVIGDSTVTQSNAISQKLLDCYAESGGRLTLLGTRGASPALHEGRAGWTSTDYCTKASNGGVTNPFYNGGFDFSHYMAQQGYSGVDAVVIQLGINDIFSMTHENFSASTTLANLDTMIDSILAYNGGIKVIVNLISPPNGNGTSFTDAYNTTQIDFVYLVNTIRLSAALIEHFDGNESVVISPNNCVLDTKTDINDGVHPNATGYAKLGQAIYETINGCVPTNGGDEPEDDGELWDAGSRTAAVNTYKPAATAGTFSNSHYYYPAAYTGALANTVNVSDVSVGDNTLQFKSASGAYGVFVPFIGLDSTKTYRFTVNPTVAGFRVYLVNYDSDGKYVGNAIIVDKTTGLNTFDFTPTAGYQQGFCFACLSATANTLGIFTDISLVEVTE